MGNLFNSSKSVFNTNTKSTKTQLDSNADTYVLTSEELRIKKSILLSNSNNPATEQDFRRTCLLYNQNSKLSSDLNEAYEEYTKSYHKITSLYLFEEVGRNTNLIIYDTESERKEIKALDTSELLDWSTFIAQIPNGELFCFGNYSNPGLALIISSNYRVRKLPSGAPCGHSSAIYFNKNVYCFGGYNYGILNLSIRFNFDTNRWIKLTPLPQNDIGYHSVVFKGNILISGFGNRNIFLYSVEIDSFSTITYDFGENKTKFLINLEERLLLFSFWDYGLIYESEIGDEYAWTMISSSRVDRTYFRVFLAYNKGGVYIGCSQGIQEKYYYKFSLNEKTLSKLGC